MNAATSPLLLLPSEVRENILTHLVGDQLIHVKYLSGMKLHDANKAKVEYIRQNKQSDTIIIEDDQADESPSHTKSDTESCIVVDTDDDDDDDDDDVVTYGNNNSNGGTAVPNAGHTSQVAGLMIPLVEDPPSVLRHAICVANQSEQSAYQETVSGHANVPEHDSPDFYIASCDERHSACSMCGSGGMFLRQDRKVDLNVLGVSRQLYEEANVLMWKTNTFSFDDPQSFEKFFGSLNPAQKRNLTHIHINVHIGYYFSTLTTVHQRSRYDELYWGKALKMSTLRMLQGVQTLHLCINLGYQGYFPALSKDASEEQIIRNQQADMEPILRLRALSVKNVTVIVSDEARKLEEGHKIAPRWTMMRKNEYAESIRVQLADDKGAERVKTEAEAANLARKTATRDNATAIVKIYKKMVRAKQAEVDRLAEWASREEAEAVVAQRKIDQSSKKGLKKYATLLRVAEAQREMATNARAMLDIAMKNQSVQQERLANAKEKRKRAMTKLGATPEEIEDESACEDLLEGLEESSTR